MRLPILITWRAKLLNADWSMKRVFFFLILLCEEGKSTCSRLVLRFSSCFSVTIVSRFETDDKEYIEELKDKSENENRKNSTEW